MKTLIFVAAILSASGTVVSAGNMIQRACMQSDRQATSRSLCGCIQDVADVTRNSNDQRLAAKFFKDPHMAQEIRQSDRRSHEVFWDKYKAFGQTAKTYCG